MMSPSAQRARLAPPPPFGAPTPGRSRRARPAWSSRWACEGVSGVGSLAAVLLLASCIALSGCRSPSAARTPREALASYAQALEEERYDDAYDLLSVETRARLSRSAFREMLTTHPEEATALVRIIESSDDAADVRATITGKDGQRLELVYEAGAWKVEASALDLFPQDTPERALGSFVSAYQKKRYDVLLRFVPEAHLEGMDPEVLAAAWEGEQAAEMDAVVSALRAALTDPSLEIVGTRATMALEGGSTVEMVLEHGVWKIEDFR